MHRWTIGKKITFGFSIVLLQALAIGAFGLWMMLQTSDTLKVVSEQYLPVTAAATRAEREILNARIHFIYFVTIQKPGSLEKGRDRFGEAVKAIEELQQLISASQALQGSRPEVEQLRRDLAQYQPALERIISSVKLGRNKGPEFDSLLLEWARLGGAMVDSAGRLGQVSSKKNEAATVGSATQLSRAVTGVAVASLSGLLLGLTIAFFVTRGINRSLKEVSQTLGLAASEVADTALQVSKAAQSLAAGSTEQAASLEETSAASEQISAMASRNADNSRTAAENMLLASQSVSDANRNLDQMSESMSEISAASGGISKITKVIDAIAFQTNILALNAAVEAARAGEAGLGFAVVANEVRNLAQQCAQAAKDTAALIEKSIVTSNDGRTRLDQVATAVRSITGSADAAKMLVDQVKLGSAEQERGIEQVSIAIADMQKVTQDTAAEAEETSAAGEILTGQSENLRGIVGLLEQMVSGGPGVRKQLSVK